MIKNDLFNIIKDMLPPLQTCYSSRFKISKSTGTFSI